jgi:hypothetical protein
MASPRQPSWLSKLRCPRCAAKSKLSALPAKKGTWGAWGRPGVKCARCKESYPVVEGGILRMIPKGDMQRYAYWEKLHSEVSAQDTIAIYDRRFGFPPATVDAEFCLPRLSRKAGWGTFASSVELGCGWGIYSMSLAKAGLLKEIWLLDISVSALKGTQQVFRHFGFEPFLLQGEIHHLPFADKAFEVSLSGGLYEHFVGDEQQQLVDENCRISSKILTELPESTVTYWIYRKFFTWWWGKWPFGFEAPLTRKRLRELYSASGAHIVAWDYHNLGTAVLFMVAERFNSLSWMVGFRPFFFFPLRHDVAVAVDAAKRG